MKCPKCGTIEAPNRVQSHCNFTRTGTCKSIWTLSQERTSLKFQMWRFYSACQDHSRCTGSSCLPTCTIGARSNWDWAPVMESWLKSSLGLGVVGLVHWCPINILPTYHGDGQPGSCLNFIPESLDTLLRRDITTNTSNCLVSLIWSKKIKLHPKSCQCGTILAMSLVPWPTWQWTMVPWCHASTSNQSHLRPVPTSAGMLHSPSGEVPPKTRWTRFVNVSIFALSHDP